MTTKQFLISAWPVHPAALAAAAALAAGYIVHWHASGRSVKGRAGFLVIATALFLLVLDSPLDALADGYLFSAHMLQHLLLQLVVPAFLLWALLPSPSFSSSYSSSKKGEGLRPALQRLGKFLTKSAVTWLAGVGGMWVWHVPALCDAATSYPVMRGIQVLSLLALGALFWLPVIGPRPQQHLPPLAGVLYLFTACVGCTLLGIIITFVPVSVCPVYLHPSGSAQMLALIRNGWGLTPAVDQQIGGLLMWVPACVIYLCGIMGLLARWYAGATEATGPIQPKGEPTTV